MHTRLKVAAAVLIAFGASGARAQGIPVIDVANLVQTIQQVLDGITQINNQVQQINQLQSQINSINGIRNLGNVFNNPLLKNYVPAEAYTYVNAINTSGYSGLNATATFPVRVSIWYWRSRSRDRAMRSSLSAMPCSICTCDISCASSAFSAPIRAWTSCTAFWSVVALIWPISDWICDRRPAADFIAS